MGKENSLEGLESIIADLERQRASIDNALKALRGITDEPIATKRGRPKGTNKAKKRAMSTEGRQRQIEAMRKYWAVKKAAAKKASKKRAAKKT